MKRHGILSVVLIAALTVSSRGFAQQPTASPRYADWRTVIQSDLVVRGRLRVPVKALQNAISAKRPNYVVLEVEIADVIKGRKPETRLQFNYYPQPAWYNPVPQTVLKADGTDVLLFLLKVDESPGSEGDPAKSGYYFAGSTPNALQPYQQAVAKKVRAEVTNQAGIVAAFNHSVSSKPGKEDAKVRGIISQVLVRSAEEKAFQDLAALGQAAVPAIIRQLDDRRPLPIKHIMVPASWEYAHYTPQVVVDALSTLLIGMAGESFRSISNGGSERERKAEVDAWRIYLHYRIQGTAGRAHRRK